MTEKDLKKMSRQKLLELLLEQVKINEELDGKVAQLEKRLSEKDLEFREIGSLAEAALKLNGVFEAADKAAQDYLRIVKLSAEKGLPDDEK